MVETMDQDKIAELMDQERWLLNNGLITDSVKNQLFFYGSLIHKDTRALKVDINLEKKLVEYEIFLDKEVIDKIELYQRLQKRTDLIGMWRFRRMLKKESNLNFNSIINKFVKDYCGPKWSATVKVTDSSLYLDGDESATAGDGWSFDQQSDKR